MGFFQSIIDAALAMSLLEIVAVFFGVASVIYSKKENILVYPTGIVSTLIYIYLCFGIKLYADMGINVFYFIMSVYGWILWGSRKGNKVINITSNSVKENVLFIAIMFVLWVLIFFVLDKYTDSDVAYIDSFTTAMCFVGMWLMAWKKVENWVFLIAADIVSIPLYWYKGFYLTSVLFLILTIIATLGYIEWKKKLSA